MGAPPKPCRLMYNHQVPAAKVATPWQKPSQAAARGVGARVHNHINKAGDNTASGQRASGANAQVSASPEAAAKP